MRWRAKIPLSWEAVPKSHAKPASAAAARRGATRYTKKFDETVRAFIAIEVNDKIRRGVTKLQSGLKISGAHMKWVRAANLHLTLAFLGNTAVDALPAVGTAMQNAVASLAPYTLDLKGVGFFGRRTPRVVWVGIHDATGRLRSTYHRLVQELRGAGVSFDEKPFAPHLTIGRVRDSLRAGDLRAQIERRQDREIGKLDVTRVVLVKSDLQPTGPIYSVIRDAPLGSPDLRD